MMYLELGGGAGSFSEISANQIMRQSLVWNSDPVMPKSSPVFSRWQSSWSAFKNYISAGSFRSWKTWQAQSCLVPEISVKASGALGGWDSLGTEPFGVSIWKLPKTNSLGLCIFTRFFSFFATLFKPLPISWSSKINCCGETHFID